MTRAEELERLLDEAREASPTERLPTYRDAIAAFGQEAIEPLATWLEEPAFAAFAIRTLGRIAANDPDTREAVAAALLTADRSTMADHVARDLDSALDQLGLSPARRAAVARARAAGPRATSARPIQNPGVGGRGYWAMRTSPWERPYILPDSQPLNLTMSSASAVSTLASDMASVWTRLSLPQGPMSAILSFQQ